ITQLDYINQASFYEGIVVSDADITRYFQDHQDRYREPPRMTFTHVFFSSDRHADPETIALERKESLNKEQVPFHLGTSYGDHFLYHRNYVGKTYDEVASHFGSGFADAVFELSKRQQWEGPVVSEYGQHLVMIGDRIAARVPPLEEVAGRIRDDLLLERVEQKRNQFFEQALARYDVEIELDGLSDGAPSP
ncbi:MAG: peptidylprolyl isomerase, partial [Pseudomonadota bacterium]